MSSVIISGDTSGAVTIAAPAVAGTNTLTLQAGTGTNSMNTLATAVASTSGTSIDFTSIPSWVKRITVMLSGVSTSGTSVYGIQIGSGSVTTTGYKSTVFNANNANGTGITAYTTLFALNTTVSAALNYYATATLTNISGNLWSISSILLPDTNAGQSGISAGSITLAGVLDRVRLTTVNGTDTFDAGTVNILYEG